VAETVYALCAVTAIVCAVLLFRGYRLNRTRLLFWASLCFAGIALENVILFVDMIILPNVDLFWWRVSVGLASMLVLLYGLVWETR
jgi:hypothetical protein